MAHDERRNERNGEENKGIARVDGVIVADIIARPVEHNNECDGRYRGDKEPRGEEEAHGEEEAGIGADGDALREIVS